MLNAGISRDEADLTPDADLVEACADFEHGHIATVRFEALMNGPEGDAVWRHCDTVHWPAQTALFARILAMRALTPEGIAAKARALQAALDEKYARTDTDQLEQDERMTLSLLRDIIGAADAFSLTGDNRARPPSSNVARSRAEQND